METIIYSIFTTTSPRYFLEIFPLTHSPDHIPSSYRQLSNLIPKYRPYFLPDSPPNAQFWLGGGLAESVRFNTAILASITASFPPLLAHLPTVYGRRSGNEWPAICQPSAKLGGVCRHFWRRRHTKAPFLSTIGRLQSANLRAIPASGRRCSILCGGHFVCPTIETYPAHQRAWLTCSLQLHYRS